jgi:hypothetical protein
MVRPDGSHRNSCYFSIIDDDWPASRQKLTALLAGKHEALKVAFQAAHW